MVAPITRTLGRFIAGLRYDALSPLAVEAVKTAATDGVAVMIDAFDMEWNKLFYPTLQTRGLSDEARIYLGNERASAAEAAFINSVALTAQDFEDVAFARCHATAVLLPAVLAEADAVGADGRRIIAAYAAGYETWARIFDYDRDPYPSKGWHATSAWGGVGAAAAVANLRGLDPDTATTAIAIAASMTGGLTGGLPYRTRLAQFAQAARTGVEAVRFAMAGLSAPPDALEAKGGLIAAMSPKGNYDLDKPVAGLDGEWRLETVGVSLKLHPFNNSTQRTLDSLFALMAENAFSAADVISVEIVIGTAQAAALDIDESGGFASDKEYYFPHRDVKLAVAAALLTRASERRHIQRTYYSQPDVQEMRKRVSFDISPDAPSDGSIVYLGGSGKIRVKLADGRLLETPYRKFNHGHWTDRATAEELWTKFRNCTSRFMPQARARALFEKLQTLERVDSVEQISVVT